MRQRGFRRRVEIRAVLHLCKSTWRTGTISFEVVKKIESFKEEGFVSIGLGPAELILIHISSKL